MDPISDMLTSIRNASIARHADLTVPYSKIKERLAILLKTEGFLADVTVKTDKFKTIFIKLKTDAQGNPVITGLKRISSPGQRIYLPSDRLPRTNGGYGITVVSTSKGLMGDRQARKEKHGGEVICQVW